MESLSAWPAVLQGALCSCPMLRVYRKAPYWGCTSHLGMGKALRELWPGAARKAEDTGKQELHKRNDAVVMKDSTMCFKERGWSHPLPQLQQLLLVAELPWIEKPVCSRAEMAGLTPGTCSQTIVQAKLQKPKDAQQELGRFQSHARLSVSVPAVKCLLLTMKNQHLRPPLEPKNGCKCFRCNCIAAQGS